MNSNLEISNFGAIKNAKIEIKPFTILIGEQAAGKSSIAKLISIFNDFDSFQFDENNIFIDFHKALKKYNIHNYLQDNTKIKYKSDFFEFEYTGEINFKPTPLFTQGLNNISFLGKSEEEMKNFFENFAERVETEKYLELMEKFLINLDIKLIEKQIQNAEILKRFSSSIYIPTERFLISILNNSAIEFMNSSLTLPKSVTQFGTYYQKAKTELGKQYREQHKKEIDLEIDFLNVTFSNKNGEDVIKFDTKELALQESASGYQSVIPLFLVMKYFSNKKTEAAGNKTFIIEEPELNLYPKTQNRLVSVLAKFANENNNNLIITTHSPYILSSINNLLFAHQIGNKMTDKEVEISKIIPKESWINAAKFSAYHIEKGKAKSIFDKKIGLIKETELDSASEIINSSFDKLMNFYKQI